MTRLYNVLKQEAKDNGSKWQVKNYHLLPATSHLPTCLLTTILPAACVA
jgi:hypothetical protein